MGVKKKKLKHVEVNEILSNLLRDYGRDIVEKELSENLGLLQPITQTVPKAIPTVEEAIEEYTTSDTSYYKHKSAQTIRGYDSEINKIKEFCNDKVIKKEHLPNGLQSLITEFFNPLVLGAYLNQYENIGTRKKKTAFFRGFLKSVAVGILDDKQIDKLLEYTLKTNVNPGEVGTPVALSPTEVDFLLSAAKETTSALRNTTILWVLIGSGIRVNELVELQVKDVLWDEEAIYIIPKGKPNKEKRFLTKVAFKVLKHYILFLYEKKKETLLKKDYGDLYVFSTKGQKPIATNTVRDMMRMLKKKGVREGILSEDKKLSPHTIRHTFAVYALESGISLYKISKLLGHESAETTQYYLKLYDYQLKEELNKHRYADVELQYLREEVNFHG
jgi:integrase/recombinase XerD